MAGVSCAERLLKFRSASSACLARSLFPATTMHPMKAAPFYFTRLLTVSFCFLFAACQTAPYRWGAADDPDWSGRAGAARFAEVVSVLGQPREQLPMADGGTKARWGGETLTVNTDPGSVNEFSEQSIEHRPLWRDMQFSSEGVLLRAWRSDQRSLADSTAP